MGEFETLDDGVRYNSEYNLRVTVFPANEARDNPRLTVDYYDEFKFTSGPTLIETELTNHTIAQLRGQEVGISTSAFVYDMVEDAARDFDDVYDKIRSVAERKFVEEWY